MCGRAGSAAAPAARCKNCRRWGRFMVASLRSFAKRDLWRSLTESLRLDRCKLDHLAPLLGFVRDELSEIGGRAGKRNAAQVRKPRLHSRVSESRVDFLVELIDDFGRCILGHAYAIPVAGLIAWHKLAHGRDIR